ncbi:MAG TPA: DUF6069 family protein [Roseiflexaceae bacterium]|nr:DUF6069 family protein [Roseiflexaceae bacterium]
MSTVAATPPHDVVARKIPLAGLIGGGIAVVANLVVYALALVAGLPLLVPMPPDLVAATLPFYSVIMSTIVGAIGGTIVFALLARFTSRPVTIFIIISVVVTLASFGMPLSLPMSLDTILVLNFMHIVAAVAIVWALVTRTRA